MLISGPFYLIDYSTFGKCILVRIHFEYYNMLIQNKLNTWILLFIGSRASTFALPDTNQAALNAASEARRFFAERPQPNVRA